MFAMNFAVGEFSKTATERIISHKPIFSNISVLSGSLFIISSIILRVHSRFSPHSGLIYQLGSFLLQQLCSIREQNLCGPKIKIDFPSSRSSSLSCLLFLRNEKRVIRKSLINYVSGEQRNSQNRAWFAICFVIEDMLEVNDCIKRPETAIIKTCPTIK